MGGLKDFMDELEKDDECNHKKGEPVVDESNGDDEESENKNEKFSDFMKKNKKPSGLAIFITSLGR